MNGILLIDKPAGLTSADVVRQIKRRLPRGTKVGHLGTLDPFATGLLPLCLGDATKVAQFLNTADKRYRGIIQLGWATDSGDGTGRETGRAPVPSLDAATLAAIAARFCGAQRQLPPMYSALKKDGVPLYKLARRGIAVEREARTVHIHHFELAAASPDRLGFDVACSKGTYVRVLAEDVGQAFGTVAHLAALQRTEFGSFRLEQAAALGGWDPQRPAGLVSVRDALGHLPQLRLDAVMANAARQGKAAVLDRLPEVPAAAAVLLDPHGEVAAVVVRAAGAWRYGRVLGGDPQSLQPGTCVVAPSVE